MRGQIHFGVVAAAMTAAFAFGAGPDVQTCDGRACPPSPVQVDTHCGHVPEGCVCEYSPRTKTWGVACPKHPR